MKTTKKKTNRTKKEKKKKESRHNEWELNLKEHSETCKYLSFSIDKNTLYSCGTDYTVRSWDIVSGNCKRIFAGNTKLGHSQPDIHKAHEICFNNNKQQKYLITCCIDGSVCIWDLNDNIRQKDEIIDGIEVSYKPLQKINAHNTNVPSIAFDLNRNLVISLFFV